ncbi:urease accessory protein UreD [Thermodesulfobacteriota bacterium B35]
MSATMPECTAEPPPGWQARLELDFAPDRRNRTLLVRNRHHGPLLVQRPLYPEQDTCHACILHPPGGVVAGDRLRLDVRVRERGGALLTTPGATRFYRSAGGTAVQEQRLRIEAGGCLEWLPQENILFPGAEVRLATRIELAADGCFMGWEVLCLGLPANGARMESGSLLATLALDRDGHPLLRERLQISAEPDLDRPAGLRGHPVTGTFVATGCDRDMAAGLRRLLPVRANMTGGITLAGDLLVARYLGHSTMEALSLFRNLWAQLRPVLRGRAACPPRIWAT